MERTIAVNQDQTLIVTGGGTGGHLFAGIAIADEWKRRFPESRILFVGAKGGIEERLVPKAGYPLETLRLGSLKGVTRKKRLQTLGQIPLALLKAASILLREKPQAVVGVGGYASGPVVLVARLLGWSLGTHTAILEQNAVPGFTNRILGRFADSVFCAFPGIEDRFQISKARVTGNPVRKTMVAFPTAARDPFTIFIFGGSQGAVGINTLVLDAFSYLVDLQPKLRWIHQTGEKDFERVYAGYEKAKVAGRVERFIYDMPECYAKASLVICRAGSSTLAELAAVRRAAILVPFPYASDNHQEKNARLFVDRGGADLLLQGKTDGRELAHKIREYFQNPKMIETMEREISKFDPGDAPGKIVTHLLWAGRSPSDGGGAMKKRPVDGKPDFPLHLHFIGIGGIGMSGIAEVFFNQGYRVSGSDVAEGDTTRRLASLGIQISIGHRPENVEGASVVVYSSAVKPTNPEFLEAKNRSIPLIPRAEALGELMRGKIGIALAGTHGKTTTTTLLSTILAGCGLDPTIVIGGKVDAFGGNAKLGQGDYVVAEADESDGSFLFLPAVYGAITNIDADHLDHYGDLAKIDDAFCAFVSRIPFYGRVYVCGDDPGVQRNLARFSKPYLTYGLGEGNHLQARDLQETIEGTSFEVHDLERGTFGRIFLAAHGAHNIRNTLAATGIALALGIPFTEIARSLANYRGVRRRFELRYNDPTLGIRIFDDYGHHPTEILATLETARSVHALSGKAGRILVAFQPHRYSRTLNSMNEFAECFAGVDVLYLNEVYAAGEETIIGATGTDLFTRIQNTPGKNPKRSIFATTLENCAEMLAKEIRAGDLVLCMGAGSVTRLPDLIREQLLLREPS